MSSSTHNTKEVLLAATQLNRQLSDTAGVHDISLSLHRGDVLGLLGLNGAGKSTTLRLLAGTLTPDSGEVVISGHSMKESPLAARQHIGYLPDTPPLYNDMRVIDYLKLAATLRRVAKNEIATKVEAVMTHCDLLEVQNKRTGQLSKGFRQRVGLAQALVHEPGVLLLDEPSNGLDPNQMQGMRHIIQTAGERQAVVFSTHLLNEAQAVCNRIAVVHQGRLIHDAPVNNNDTQLEDLFNNLMHDQSKVQSA